MGLELAEGHCPKSVNQKPTLQWKSLQTKSSEPREAITIAAHIYLCKHQRLPESVKLAKFSAKLVANFRRSLDDDFRASFAGENSQRHFPPKLHRKFHHQTSLRGSGLWRAHIFHSLR